MSRKSKFYLTGEPSDKDLWLVTPNDELRITFDNDDVSKVIAVPLFERVIAILNDHWDDPEYAHLKPVITGVDEAAIDADYEAAKIKLGKMFA